jgi:hypothetical protein
MLTISDNNTRLQLKHYGNIESSKHTKSQQFKLFESEFGIASNTRWQQKDHLLKLESGLH